MDHGQKISLLVAQTVDRHRRERGWTLDTLADAAGLHRTSIGLIVRGKRSMTMATAARISQALGLPLSELIAQAESAKD